MGMSHGDRVLEQTTTTGTGTITLTGAVTGYRAFASIATADGDQFPYVIAGASEWEVGIGTRASATTFARTTVTASSNAGALVNFSAGTKEVWIDFSSAFINGMRANNMIVNGGQEVSQIYGTTAQTAFAGTLTDMYAYNKGGAHVATCQQVSDAPPGFKNSFKVSITTANAAPGADDYAIINGAIEAYRGARLGYGAAGALSISRSLWVKAHRAGAYSIAFVNAAFDRSYTTTFTINAADTWEYKTFVIPGDVTGTWGSTNGAFFYFYVTLMAGTNYQQTAGSWASPAAHGWAYGATGTINGVAATSDTFQITGESIVQGNVPVSEDMSSLIVPPFDQALGDCQRYYEKSFPYTVAPAQNAGTDGSYVWAAITAAATQQRTSVVPFKVRKRGNATLTLYNPSAANAQVRDLIAGDCTSSSATIDGDTGFTIACVGNAGTGVQSNLAVQWTADARL